MHHERERGLGRLVSVADSRDYTLNDPVLGAIGDVDGGEGKYCGHAITPMTPGRAGGDLCQLVQSPCYFEKYRPKVPTSLTTFGAACVYGVNLSLF